MKFPNAVSSPMAPFRKNPEAALSASADGVLLVTNHKKPALYALTPQAFEALQAQGTPLAVVDAPMAQLRRNPGRLVQSAGGAVRVANHKRAAFVVVSAQVLEAHGAEQA